MRAIGIDLGTTNSVAATGVGETKVLPSQANESFTPSVVGFLKRRGATEGEIIVGRTAVNNAARDPINTIFSIKRLMGRSYGEPRVEEVHKHFSYQLADAPGANTEDQGVKVLLDGKPFSPPEISALILTQVKAGAELALGEEVTHAVITVPAYFQERQRSATMEAGERAGLKIIEIIDEPTAASIAFGLGKESERHRVLVYDLGGGTFDISIVQMTKGQYDVLEIAGNNWLGGDDFDRTIVKRMALWVTNEYGVDPTSNLAFQIKAKIEAEKAKIALSAQHSYLISVPMMFSTPDTGMVDIELEITREEFENDIRPFVDESIDLVNGALAHQNLTPDGITEVLLVGGSTAVPLVQQRVQQLFGAAKVKRHVNPMDCVALGAAVRAAAATPAEGEPDPTRPTGPRVQGVTAMDLGIAAVRGDNPDAFVPIIPRGTHYPLEEPRRRQFYPVAENQTLIRVPVYEGLNEFASDNDPQGVIEFPLPEEIDSSTPVEVAFNYDSNRILTVTVRVVGTDHVYTETLKRSPPIARSGSANKSLADDWREELQPTIRSAKHFLESYGEFMSAEDRQEIQEGIREGESSLEANSRDAGEKARRELYNRFFVSGVASWLYIAEQQMRGLPAETSQIIGRAVSSLRSAHKRGDAAEVKRLIDELRVVIAKLREDDAKIKEVPDSPDFKDLLQFRG